MHANFSKVKPRVRGAARLGLAAALTLTQISLISSFSRTGAAAMGDQQAAEKLSRFVQTAAQTPAMKLFREGRDLLDEGQWARAAEKFNGFVTTYPKDRDVDAAYYWLAYALAKQGRKSDASAWLARLFREHPDSAWRDDAEALLVQLGDQQAVRRGLEEKENLELKVVALQSLFENNTARAVEYVAEMLRPGSAASPRMRQAAIALLATHGGRQGAPLLLRIARDRSESAESRKVAIRHLGENGGEAVIDDLRGIYQAERDEGIKSQVLHALSEISGPRATALLLEVARNQSEDVSLRESAIRWLGERHDSAFAELSQLYDADLNPRIRGRILRSLSEMRDPRAAQKLLEVARAGANPELRRSAIRWLAEKDTDAVAEELIRIYDADQSDDVKMQILHSLSEMRSPRARARLSEVARSGRNLQLRAAAIRWLVDEGDSPQTVDLLAGLYDAEKDSQVKASILRALGESRQKAALRKLMDVARRDPSVELRKMAIHEIGESRDPEALKFLEELLKQ